MREWDVDLEFRASAALTETAAEQFVESLARYGGAVGYRGDHLSARATVRASDPAEALRITREALAGAAADFELTAVEVREAEPIEDGGPVRAAS
jgi:hypothetical protein